jgi:hypothetical protein
VIVPVLVGALLGFILGSIFGVGVAVRFLEWARANPETLSDSVDELIRRERER